MFGAYFPVSSNHPTQTQHCLYNLTPDYLSSRSYNHTALMCVFFIVSKCLAGRFCHVEVKQFVFSIVASQVPCKQEVPIICNSSVYANSGNCHHPHPEDPSCCPGQHWLSSKAPMSLFQQPSHRPSHHRIRPEHPRLHSGHQMPIALQPTAPFKLPTVFILAQTPPTAPFKQPTSFSPSTQRTGQQRRRYCLGHVRCHKQGEFREMGDYHLVPCKFRRACLHLAKRPPLATSNPLLA